MLSLRDLTKGFALGTDKVLALDRLSIELERGEVVGLVGPNGSGKTTLLRILAGDLRPDEGKIELEGRNVTAQPRQERARWVAWVDQDPRHGTFPHLTVAENMDLALLRASSPWRWRGTSPAAKLRTHIAGFSPTLPDRLDQPAGSLSGGERQLLSIAMALAVDGVALLCLDEPWAALDESATAQVVEVVARLAGDKRVTVLLATHDIALVKRVASRLLVLHRGRLAGETQAADGHAALDEHMRQPAVDRAPKTAED